MMGTFLSSLLLAGFALSMCLSALADLPSVLAGKVIAVQDGDTITMLDAEQESYRVRLSGIDAPEMSQIFGNVSRDNLAQLCAGRLVKASCPKLDRYGRYVCTVWVGEVDVSLAQLRTGLAWHFKRYENEQDPQEREEYARAEVEARGRRLGLWQEVAPIAPWEWRRAKTNNVIPQGDGGP